METNWEKIDTYVYGKPEKHGKFVCHVFPRIWLIFFYRFSRQTKSFSLSLFWFIFHLVCLSSLKKLIFVYLSEVFQLVVDLWRGSWLEGFTPSYEYLSDGSAFVWNFEKQVLLNFVQSSLIENRENFNVGFLCSDENQQTLKFFLKQILVIASLIKWHKIVQ